jgi:hypothetical protein
MRRLLGTLGFALGALALTGCWAVPGGDGDRSNHNPWEDELTAETVDGLTEQWRWTPPADSELTDPVVSNSGVHVGAGCGLATLRPSTGELLWGDATGTLEMCTSGFYVRPGEPYVFDGPSRQRVQGSSGISVPRAPSNFIAQFSTRDFDARTGEASSEPGLGGFLVARRGSQQVHSTVGPVGPLTAANFVSVGGRQFTQHVFMWGTPPMPPTAFTLGADKLYQAGGGVLASEPGTAVFGNGIRGYSITESRPGCGPVSAGFPTPSPHPVECPVWATPTDGIPTIPVLSPNGDTVYTRTSAGTLYAIDTANGAVRWTATGLGDAGKPALAQGLVFVPTDTGRVLLFDAAGCGGAICPPDSPTGFDTGSGAAVTAVSVAGNVIYATSAGNVHASGECFSGEGCLLAWSGPGNGSPVISGGQLYVRQGGDLVAYGLDD